MDTGGSATCRAESRNSIVQASGCSGLSSGLAIGLNGSMVVIGLTSFVSAIEPRGQERPCGGLIDVSAARVTEDKRDRLLLSTTSAIHVAARPAPAPLAI